ncbi:MAG: signal peptide peptidase SppA [Myxococcota bacterium]
MSTGSKIRILIMLLVFALGVFFVSRQLNGPAPVLVAEDSTLVIEMGGTYIEGPPASPLARLAGESSQSFMGLLSMFSLAERDERLGTVVLRIRTLGIGWGKADELRAAIERLREKGVHTVAHLEIQNFSANKELYIGSAADEMFVAPGAAVPLVGLAAEYLFLGGLMEKVGVDFDVAKAGRYKSAVEAYSARGMSEASREMANSLLDDSYARFVSGLAAGRNLTPQAVRDAIDTGSVRNQRLEALGLIDGEAHLDELIDRYGEDVVQHVEYAGTDPATLGFNAQTEFALIYGSGTVVQGESGGSPLESGPAFASDTVSRAILDAAEDDSISAIILRIDSPGGSALASELIWRAIIRAREAGKPVIASFSDVAASGGYYVAAAADSIVSDPGTLTGSIGVFALRPTVGGLLEKLEIGIDSLTRGKHAEFLLSSEKMSPGALARLQTSVLDTYQLFLTRVADGRGLTNEDVDQVGQGRVWTGQQAFERGLVDELGGIYTAVRRAKESVGLSAEDDVFLIPFPKQKTFSEQIFGVLQSTRAEATSPLRLLPEPLASVVGWAAMLPSGTPLLIPPVLMEIR